MGLFTKERHFTSSSLWFTYRGSSIIKLIHKIETLIKEVDEIKSQWFITNYDLELILFIICDLQYAKRHLLRYLVGPSTRPSTRP